MNPIKLLGIIWLTAIIGGCNLSSSESKPEQPKAAINTDATFNAYLKLKRIKSDDKQLLERERSRYLEREGLASVIEKQGLLDATTINVEINEFRKQMLISRYFETFLRDKVNEQAIRNFYAGNPDRFQSQKAQVAHILIRTNQKMSEQERKALLTKAQEVYSRAMANEDFGKLAQEFSDDVLSAKKAGDLGWIQEGAVDPAFSKKVFEMKTDEISHPIATPYGFHVVKIINESQVVKKPYEKVKGDIRFQLRQQAKQAEMERLKTLMQM